MPTKVAYALSVCIVGFLVVWMPERADANAACLEGRYAVTGTFAPPTVIEVVREGDRLILRGGWGISNEPLHDSGVSGSTFVAHNENVFGSATYSGTCSGGQINGTFQNSSGFVGTMTGSLIGAPNAPVVQPQSSPIAAIPGANSTRTNQPGSVYGSQPQPPEVPHPQVVEPYLNAFNRAIDQALRSGPSPAVPGEAARHADAALAAIRNARSSGDFETARSEYRAALKIAPWWADGWFNLAALDEQMGAAGDAATDLSFYLRASPGARDHEAIQRKIEALRSQLAR